MQSIAFQRTWNGITIRGTTGLAPFIFLQTCQTSFRPVAQTINFPGWWNNFQVCCAFFKRFHNFKRHFALFRIHFSMICYFTSLLNDQDTNELHFSFSNDFLRSTFITLLKIAHISTINVVTFCHTFMVHEHTNLANVAQYHITYLNAS